MPTQPKRKKDILRTRARLRVPQQRRADPYRSDMKVAGHPKCASCAAVFTRGKWFSQTQALRKKVPVDSYGSSRTEVCPACRQLKDHYALGVVELRLEDRGSLPRILRTLTNSERIQRARNDQERILWTGTAGDTTRIYTTLPELARTLGRVLERTFKGRVEYVRSGKEPFLFVIWEEGAAPRYRTLRKDHLTEHRSRRWRGRGAA
jgi:hypothetical protein